MSKYLLYFPAIGELRDFVTEAGEKKFPDSPLLQSLEDAIAEAEKCAAVANQLVSTKVRTRSVTANYQ